MSAQKTMFGSRRRNIDDVIEANLDALLRFAYFRVGDRVEAEDIVYEAVLRLLENSHKVNDAKCYLFSIVYNLCQDKFRKKQVPTVPFERIDLPDETENRLGLEATARIEREHEGCRRNEDGSSRMHHVDAL